jgi:LuxR family maltose regulon positive regulatory protein
VLPDGHFYARGVLQLSLTLSLQSNGEAAMAEHMLTAALAQAELSEAGSAALLRPLLCLLSFYFAEGDLAPAAQIARLLLHKSVETKSAFNQQIAHLALGAAAYEVDNLRGAVYHFQEGVNLWELGSVRASHECLVGLALSHQALGQKDAVRRVVQQMNEFHAETGSSVLAAEALSLQRRLGLAPVGTRTDVRQRSVPVRTGMWYGWLELPALTQVRLALADGQPRSLAQVESALSQLWAAAVDLHKPTYQAALLALKTVLHLKRRQRPAAKATLCQALELGEERGLVRCIADAGPELEPLIEELSITQPSAYLERLRAAIGCSTIAGHVVENKQRPVRLEAALTRREREVLALLGQYRTDREIAETLVISPLTVRTHIENLSSKLEVNGRRAIVSRAREHGLLA